MRQAASTKWWLDVLGALGNHFSKHESKAPVNDQVELRTGLRYRTYQVPVTETLEDDY
jgi:hypothetical protein